MEKLSKPEPYDHTICVWMLPEGTKPAVRVDTDTKCVVSSILFETVCNTIRLNPNSRQCFALFKGLSQRTKKYGEEETIQLPCKFIISLQKWCFDVRKETKLIKTDAMAFRLLANQHQHLIDNNLINIDDKTTDELNTYLDGKFPCYKQYVEHARTLPYYDTLIIPNVQFTKTVQLKSRILNVGTKADVRCSRQNMTLFTPNVELSIPWRKIRRWTQVNKGSEVGYEIFSVEESAFVWMHLATPQAVLLLQATVEMVESIENKDKKQSTLGMLKNEASSNGSENKFNWKLFKQEIFGIEGKKGSKRKHIGFNGIDIEADALDENEIEFDGLESSDSESSSADETDSDDSSIFSVVPPGPRRSKPYLVDDSDSPDA